MRKAMLSVLIWQQTRAAHSLLLEHAVGDLTEKSKTNIPLIAGNFAKHKIPKRDNSCVWTISSQDLQIERLGSTISQYDVLQRNGEWLSYETYSIARKVGQYTNDGELIKVYDSVREAKKVASAVPLVLSGDRKRAGGYMWKYIDN